MDASERIQKLLDLLEVNAVAFASALGKDRPQFIYDIIKGKTRNITPGLARQITSVYPQVNSVWLLTGEGDMLVNEVSGSNNTSIAGNSNNVNSSSTIEKAIDEISEMRKLLQTSVDNNRQQFNQFMELINNLTAK